MTTNKVINDASRSAQGTIYQVYVALEKCFEMTSGQSLVIERLGDITIPGNTQIEVKMYSQDSSLTDNHPNFWNTLKNWMDDSSNVSQFSALVLHTTQDFGARSKFKDWNTSSLEKRLEILSEIHKSSESRFASSQAKDVPDGLRLQRIVMDPKRADRLKLVTNLISIADQSEDLTGTYNKIMGRYCGHIPEVNRSAYLSALLGLVIKPETIETSWTISKAGFDSNMQTIVPHFVQGTKRFPVTHRCSTHAPLSTEHEALRSHPFVGKILEINHHNQVPQALKDYLFTQKTMLSEFSNYSAEETEYKRYAEEVESKFVLGYQSANWQVATQIEDSQRFFNQTIREDSPQFSGRETPPREFKNGVIHMHMNDGSKNLKWKLEP